MPVDHLDNGGGWVGNWDDLSGDGVLDYEIDLVMFHVANPATAVLGAERARRGRGS